MNEFQEEVVDILKDKAVEIYCHARVVCAIG